MINNLFTYNNGRGNRHSNFANGRNGNDVLHRLPKNSKSPKVRRSPMNQDLSFDQQANRSQPLELIP